MSISKRPKHNLLVITAVLLNLTAQPSVSLCSYSFK